MPKTLLFNPDNDLALANGNSNYLPPRSAVRMAYDLSLLPVWWASDGDAVMIPDSSLLHYWNITLADSLNMPDVEWITDAENIPKQPLSPWGWNPSLVKRLSRRMTNKDLLPTPAQMEHIRRLSGRQVSVCILRDLMEELSGSHPLVGEAVYCTSEDEIRVAISRHAHSILKAPWSGSGKGLRRTSGTYEPPFSGWCRHILSQQGGVVVEPLYNKVKDVAMEFYSDGSGSPLAFVGYSYFMTDANGSYEGNALMSDVEIESLLSSYIPLSALHAVRSYLSVRLSKALSSDYRGYVGVDMMVCLSENAGQPSKYFLNPCVEVNLRMNMGVVAHLIFEKYVSPGSHGRFMVEYFPSSDDLHKTHEARLSASPLVYSSDGRILSGYHPLTPVAPETRYMAWIEIYQRHEDASFSYPTVLSVAGSDSSGGAGVQADLKTISALGGYATTAITSVTIQDTLGVHASHPIPADVVAGQIKAVMDDLRPDVVKIGMTGSADVVRVIAATLSDYPHTPVIYDPVMVSTSGHPLMSEDAIEVAKQLLFPLCTLITPNLHEAETLTGLPFATLGDMLSGIRHLRQWGGYAVLLKGGHLEGDDMVDFLLMPDADEPQIFRSPKVETSNTHGTGCTLSSAIATFVAQGCPLPEAVRRAKEYVSEAIREGADVQIGHGHGPLNHFFSPLPARKNSQVGP